MDGGDRAAGLALQRRFAPPDDALVGLDLHEDVGPVGLRIDGDPDGLDARDFQAVL